MKRWNLITPRSLALALSVVLVACFSEDATPPPLPVTQAAVARGQQIAEGFGSCGFCHSMQGAFGASLGGGRQMEDIYGDIVGPNITISSSGIGEWRETDVKNLFRSNQRPDESQVYSPFHRGFEWMSDADLTALIAYLRSVPPAENVVERREPSFIDRNTTGFFRSKAEVKGYVPSIAPSFRAEYGQYVADNLAGCARCHSRPGGLFSSDEYLAGGQEVSFDGESKVAPNITSSKTSGIGEWSEDDIKRFLATGQTPSGRQVDKKFCPVEFYARAPSADVDALVAYLRSVPAIE